MRSGDGLSSYVQIDHTVPVSDLKLNARLCALDIVEHFSMSLDGHTVSRSSTCEHLEGAPALVVVPAGVFLAWHVPGGTMFNAQAWLFDGAVHHVTIPSSAEMARPARRNTADQPARAA